MLACNTRCFLPEFVWLDDLVGELRRHPFKQTGTISREILIGVLGLLLSWQSDGFKHVLYVHRLGKKFHITNGSLQVGVGPTPLQFPCSIGKHNTWTVPVKLDGMNSPDSDFLKNPLETSPSFTVAVGRDLLPSKKRRFHDFAGEFLDLSPPSHDHRRDPGTCLRPAPVPPQVDSTHQRILDLMVRSEAMQRQRESGNIRNVAWRDAQGYVGMRRRCSSGSTQMG